ncbi:hypothetical protein B0H12DRAFT_1040625, partial [Mycena haematopus]
KKQKADPKRYDASGIFVLTCRHSQVLFLADIDTPGEQQQYIVALMEEVISHLPPQATVVQAYDVGCVTDRSINLYPILLPGLRERVSFIVNVMHSYGHQWICQLFYSPRLWRGLGLADLEGVERFWSRIRKLIGMTRSQWNSRRIWTLDQYTSFVNDDGRDNLGAWIIRQQTKNVARKQSSAVKLLRECRVPEAELRQQWAEQKAAQRSLRSHAPARLRRKLDQVLRLQTQIDTVEKAIADAKESITDDADASHDSLEICRGLEQTHAKLSSQAEALYASLNIPQNFPELAHLPIVFVRTLIIMRDLKIWIRKKAVSTFFEWESLDQAVAGKKESIGTKMHQNTRRAIAKRKPALINAISKFNVYCATLEKLRPPGCLIPVPLPLSPGLSGLCDDLVLQEDVWVTPAHVTIPRWLQDDDVPDGIRGLHAADRCAEEVLRLALERQNMSRWLAQEGAIVARAIETSQGVAVASNSAVVSASVAFHPVVSASVASASVASNASVASITLTSITSSTAIPPAVAMPVLQEVAIHLEDPEGFFDDGAEDDDIVVAEELDAGTVSDIEIIQEMFANGDEEEESSCVDGAAVQFEIRWENPVLGRNGRGDHTLEADDVDRIRSRTGRLNNFALNGLAASLLNLFDGSSELHAPHASQCAVLNTYNIHRVRFKATDAILWKNLSPTQYWDKGLWLVPIHRASEEHWVVVVVAVREQKLFFFDSFAQRQGWRRDLRDVMILITRMVVLANCHNHPLYVSTEEEPWIAQPMFKVPRQSNGHDCGVWVVCLMGAILRGHTDIALSEAEMGRARRILADHVLTLSYAPHRAR